MVETGKKPSFAEAAKGSFGKEAKDSQDSFELCLKAPGKKLLIEDVLNAFKAGNKTTIFGLRREHYDLVASFHSKEERDHLCEAKLLKVKGTEIEVSVFPRQFPPLSSAFRSVISQVPMTATGSAIAKAIAHLSPLNFFIEKYKGTEIRTGRVILWTSSAPKENFVYVNGTKTTMKPLDKQKETKKTTSATATSSEGSKVSTYQPISLIPVPVKEGLGVIMEDSPPVSPTSSKAVEHGTTPKGKKRKVEERSPPELGARPPKVRTHPLEEPADTVDEMICSSFGLDAPDGPAVISIYEDLATAGEALSASKAVPISFPDKATTFRAVLKDKDSNRIHFCVMQSLMAKDSGFPTNTYDSFCEDASIRENRWVQLIRKGKKAILVVYRSRIAHYREKQKTKNTNKQNPE